MKWRQIPFALGYDVSEQGDIRNRSTGKHLRPCVLKRGGYLAVSLWSQNKGKTWPIHVIVATVFHGERPSPGHHAAHQNGLNTDNRRENVAWKTRVANEADKRRHGTSNACERNGSAKLTVETVVAIRAAHAAGESQSSIVRRFGVEQSHASRIISKQLWKDVA